MLKSLVYVSHCFGTAIFLNIIMKIYLSILVINSLSLLLVLDLIIVVRLFQPLAGGLFLPPPTPPYPTAWLLTYAFHLLCAIPPLVCAFTFAVLGKIRPKNKNQNFLLGSTLLTGGFLLNEVYRIHIILLSFGLAKPITISVYALASLAYGLIFWRRIQLTPYPILLLGVSLLLMAILVDLFRLGSYPIRDFLEGIPKLFSGLNIALYYWWVCYEQILQAFKLRYRE